MSDLYVSWSEYHKNIEQLAVEVYQSGWDFNQIVCIAKGGLRVGDIFCRLFEKPLAIISASSYGGENNRVRGEVTFANHLTMVTPHLGNKVLLVDDLADSGMSLKATVEWLNENRREEITELRTAVIWYKASSIVEPDYYTTYLPENPWIHQPFEIYEQMTPAELATRYPQLSLQES